MQYNMYVEVYTPNPTWQIYVHTFRPTVRDLNNITSMEGVSEYGY